MKKTLKIKIFSVLSVIALAFGAAAFAGFKPQSALADTVSGFEMIEGASVRLTDENRGIRFAAKFPETFYSESAEYHMMIIPVALKNKYNLTQSSDFYKILVQDNKLDVAITNSLPEAKNGEYYVYGSLTDILYRNANCKFFGIAYRELNGERVYATYSDGQNERTICEVAGHALNDLSKTYTEDEKNYLLKMVNDGYKNELGLAENDVPETPLESLLSVTANKTNFIMTKGSVAVPDVIACSDESNMAAKLGLTLGYKISDKNLLTVNKNGSLTASSENSGMVTCKAVLLGKEESNEHKIMVRSEMAGNMLEDYADECSKKPFGSDKQSWINGGGTAGATAWLETYEGRNGVIKMKSGTGDNSGAVRYFYNRSYEEMINLDFDYISVWAYFDNLGEGNETVTVKNGSLVLGEAIAPKKWVELKIRKDQINSASSWYKTYENYCARHDAAEQHGGVANNGTLIFSTSLEGIDVYLDSVSFVKFSVPEYTVPAGGEEFELPKVKMLGINGEVLCESKSTTVTLKHENSGSARKISSEVAVINGKIRIHSGTYTISYTFEYNGENFVKEIQIAGKTAALAGNALEDFDDPSRIKNFEPWNRAVKETIDWLEYYDGKYGVVHGVAGHDSGISFYFNKTVEELENLDFDYIEVTIWANHTADTLAIRTGSYALGTIKCREWQTITITKDVIVNEATCWYNSNTTNIESGGGMKAFAFRHSAANGKGGYYLFSFPWSGVELYVDSILFYKNA